MSAAPTLLAGGLLRCSARSFDAAAMATLTRRMPRCLLLTQSGHRAAADECVWYDSLMDGVHDMGGMDGFGKIEVEKNEPVFHAEWEGRVLAMQRAMSYAGAWRIDHSRFAKEQLPPITYLSASYYQRWVLGMEKNIIERDFATAQELKAGHATTAGKMLRRKLTVSVLQDALARPSYFRQQQAPALFKPGDRVRTRNIHPKTHTPARLCAGKVGRGGAVPRLSRVS